MSTVVHHVTVTGYEIDPVTGIVEITFDWAGSSYGRQFPSVAAMIDYAHDPINDSAEAIKHALAWWCARDDDMSKTW